MLGALAGAMGGGGGGGGGGDKPAGGCAQNTPAINIIDNARIMMLPGSVPNMPMGGMQMGGGMPGGGMPPQGMQPQGMPGM